MCISLMSHIPDQLILWKIKHIVQGKCQLYHTQIGCQMSACLTYCLDQKAPDFLGKAWKILQRNFMNIIWLFNFFQNHSYPSFVLSISCGLQGFPQEAPETHSSVKAPQEALPHDQKVLLPFRLPPRSP